MVKQTRRSMLKAGGTAVLGAVGATTLSETAAADYVGLPVYTTADLSVRSGPGLGYNRVAVSEQYTGGYIVDGPVSSDGYTWWKLDYCGDSNNGRVTGWSVEQYLANADFAYPATGYCSSDWYDSRSYGYHSAVDITNDTGTPILAARSGTVSVVGYESGGCGNYIKVDHGAGYTSLYCHLSSVWVSEGQSVGTGDQIGEMGSTGNSTGPHVHFAIRLNGADKYVPGEKGDEIQELAGLAKDYDGIGSF
ncbi:peptidoglycan DD-metalloendopeptidase family protein [Haloarchaeobius sp. TZWWS8]|uniref:peptidoglycan DD-metalloendopeptidase family protein n=1 Tax=Haloarchaeobius sp. TZWWS8 TaxID=3446121 RepID=UPI003EB71CB5